MLRVVLALALAAGVSAECPNACSGHGTCGAYDMCTCYRNFQGADCSERTCPFGLAHVDSPKGDLDSSATALDSTTTVITGSNVYPYGTTELFPSMKDTATNDLAESAHYYMECSNKGICERKDGVCECFEGYEGSACQRASCPNDCSGHGTCEHIETLAASDFGNIYELWDEGMTMGCKCDPGFSGADCSGRDCKYGVDPLYVDDEASARVEEISYSITYPKTITGGAGGVSAGTYAIKFYDVFGEDYTTEPLVVASAHDTAAGTSSCGSIVSALEKLPNTVIKASSVVCSATMTDGVTTTAEAEKYSLTFTGNPGYLKQIEIDTYLDGSRPTVYSATTSAGSAETVNDGDPVVAIYNEGVSGAFVDYFASRCEGVTAELAGARATGTDGITGTATTHELKSGFTLSLTDPEKAYLKKCLGDSDGDDTYESNVEVYDWDYGSYVPGTGNSQTVTFRTMGSHPHAVKMVKVGASNFDAGNFFLTWFDGTDFQLANAPALAASSTTLAADAGVSFNVYTTDGIVERIITGTKDNLNTGKNRQADASKTLEEQRKVTGYFAAASNVIYTSTDVACETNAWANAASGATVTVEPCLQKGDLIFVINSGYISDTQDSTTAGSTLVAPKDVKSETGNLYEVKKIYKADATASTLTGVEDRYRIVVDKNIPFDGTSTSTAASYGGKSGAASVGIVNLFKFSPATTGNYEYVSQCSNRGSCVDGQCECYKGYTNDNCDTQSAYAV